MAHRVAIVEGVRTPYVRSWGKFWDLWASDLAAITFKALVAKTGVDPVLIEEVVLGNIAPPYQGGCSARIAAKLAGFPDCVPGQTVNRNCGSGMQAIATGANLIKNGDARIVLVGGAESMSKANFTYTTKEAQAYWAARIAAPHLWQRPLVELKFRHRERVPRSGLALGLFDPISELNMGQTAQNLANDFGISREAQDEFAVMSHMRVAEATRSGKFADEIIPVFLPPEFTTIVQHDDGFRDYANPEEGRATLAKLAPRDEFALKEYGKEFATVTPGNSSQITDGASALLLMREDIARARGFKPLGYVVDFAAVGCDSSRMGLGPVFAMYKVLTKAGMSLGDMGLVEINEAFAAQVIACERALASERYLEQHVGFGWWRLRPGLNRDILNVNGGAIALGHPVGASGARIVLALLKEMNRRNVNLGLATICIGGGQGAAMIVQKEAWR